MKKIVFVFAFLFTISFHTNAQWFWQNPYPSGNGLKSIFFTNSDNGYAVGYKGTFLKYTNDIGWKLVSNESIQDNINSVFFVNDNEGWAVTEVMDSTNLGRVFKTKDGGNNWYQIYRINSNINNLFFVDQNIGWIVGNGLIAKTTDGGLNWINQLSLSTDNIYTCFFKDSLTGWVAGANIILHTTNGGNNWLEQNLNYPGTYQSMSFADDQNGWIAGKVSDFPYNASLLRTTDGGNTWFENISDSKELTCVFFIDSLNGWLNNRVGTVKRTTDAGNNWVVIFDFNDNYKIEYVFFTNKDTGWASGSNGHIFRTTNSGLNWEEQTTGLRKDIIDLTFADSINGWAITSIGHIFKTIDGGKNWENRFQPNRFLSAITFVDNLYGFVVGHQFIYPPPAPWNGGIVMRTTDGGLNWHDVTFPTYYYLYSVCFIDRQTGFVGGTEGSFYKTTNSGNTWTKINLPISGTITEIYFSDSLAGWAFSLGDSKLFKTTDGGNTWYQTGFNYQIVINSIFFFNYEIGWVGGLKLLKTTDGGNTWNEPLPLGSFTDIYFSDINTGWVVGDYNLKTTNGGNTWEKILIPSQPLINGVQFINNELGWVVGNNGVILHTTNGGVTFIEEENNFTQPQQFLLKQNYPNPFNPSTTIQYAINSTQFVSLKVYDLLGREVATLVNEEKTTGSYEVEFGVKSLELSSGIYFYQLKAGDFVETKKMILLK